MVAISVRPSKEWGNGSTPESRSRASFSRRSAMTCDSECSGCSGSLIGRRAYPACGGLRSGCFDLGDLELALRPAGDLDGDDIAALVADEGLTDRRFVRELALRG